MQYGRNSTMLGANSGDFRERTAVKQLRITPDGERFLCAVDGAVSASAHEILGVVTAWYRPRWWRRPSLRRMNFRPSTVSGAN
jgi:hypothetical protein